MAGPQARHGVTRFRVLANAGFLVLDTGERISTDDGLFAEARLDILHLQEARGELAGVPLA